MLLNYVQPGSIRSLSFRYKDETQLKIITQIVSNWSQNNNYHIWMEHVLIYLTDVVVAAAAMNEGSDGAVVAIIAVNKGGNDDVTTVTVATANVNKGVMVLPLPLCLDLEQGEMWYSPYFSSISSPLLLLLLCITVLLTLIHIHTWWLILVAGCDMSPSHLISSW